MSDDGGVQWWSQQGQQEEYEAWLLDQQEQEAYQLYLDYLETQDGNS